MNAEDKPIHSEKKPRDPGVSKSELNSVVLPRPLLPARRRRPELERVRVATRGCSCLLGSRKGDEVFCRFLGRQLLTSPFNFGATIS